VVPTAIPKQDVTVVQVDTVQTALGEVEVAVIEGSRRPVLFFPGGHCSAVCDCGWDLYARLGHTVVSFSRPGYGSTSVGDLSAAEFVPAVEQTCSALALGEVAAIVGVSFGGLQAVCTALSEEVAAPRLVLHSAAPSTLPYPDSWAERVAGPIVFGPRLQAGTWAAISRAVRTERGLRAMSGALSTLPVDHWWPTLSREDRDRARALFRTMSSGRGFVNDVRQAGPDTSGYRHWLLQQVSLPTLITASRTDAGVDFAHAEDLASTIPGARFIELDAPSHLFWLGPQAVSARRAVRTFLSAPG
jgi:pimeloyl-ACP methyl ester carboxylesterase